MERHGSHWIRGGQITAHFVSIEAVEETEGNGFTLWPNPASGALQIEGVEAKEVQICNALGQMLKTVRNTNEISVSDLPQGVYLLRITDAKGVSQTEHVTVIK